ncbi:hypothetical protein B0H14DRAFT_3151934 [Mycena olivaceomarginata]|nr:hypothetical protein B0H14DRAFT_3151934 [Mycena olivaceomarginata]
MTRIIICMAAEASRRLLSTGHYLQSDIAFRRIVGFLEFELACMERDANTKIEAIVKEDTGKSLKWRHLHATSTDSSEGYGDLILSWTADQHRGQAKGLGLHLQKLASNMPRKADLHQPERDIQDLNPYDHLRRIYRICTVHNFRNIKKCSVSDEVRWLMRSLVCMEHDDWDGTLLKIREKGGKAGNDWINDKESSKFFFSGICWEHSFIPIDIWSAGDANSNLVESVHRDVNREGVHCTLLGGLKKGQLFDTIKMKTLSTYESYGITPSYKTGHISENAFHNLKRKSNTQHRVLTGEDQKIECYNERLVKSLDAMVKAEKAVSAKEQELLEESRPEKRQKLEATNGEKFIEKGIGQGQIAHRNGHGLKIKRENLRVEYYVLLNSDSECKGRRGDFIHTVKVDVQREGGEGDAAGAITARVGVTRDDTIVYGDRGRSLGCGGLDDHNHGGGQQRQRHPPGRGGAAAGNSDSLCCNSGERGTLGRLGGGSDRPSQQGQLRLGRGGRGGLHHRGCSLRDRGSFRDSGRGGVEAWSSAATMAAEMGARVGVEADTPTVADSAAAGVAVEGEAAVVAAGAANKDSVGEDRGLGDDRKGRHCCRRRRATPVEAGRTTISIHPCPTQTAVSNSLLAAQVRASCAGFVWWSIREFSDGGPYVRYSRRHDRALRSSSTVTVVATVLRAGAAARAKATSVIASFAVWKLFFDPSQLDQCTMYSFSAMEDLILCEHEHEYVNRRELSPVDAFSCTGTRATIVERISCPPGALGTVPDGSLKQDGRRANP